MSYFRLISIDQKKKVSNIINSSNKEKSNQNNTCLDLFQKYQEDVYRIAFVYVKNKDDALDIVQEVAYRAFKTFHTLKETQYFKTWLIKITIRCSIDLLRDKKKSTNGLVGSIDFLSSDEGDIPLSITLQDLLETLNEDEKSVVLLKYYQDYTFKSISNVLHIPVSTVKSILYRALEKLRKNAKGEDIYGQ